MCKEERKTSRITITKRKLKGLKTNCTDERDKRYARHDVNAKNKP